MAWGTLVQQASASGSGVSSLNLSFTGTTAKNFIAVFTDTINGFGSVTSIAVSDDVNGTYSLAKFQDTASDVIACALHYFPNGAGGSVTITSDPDGGAHDTETIIIVASEFAGGAHLLTLCGATSHNAFSNPIQTGSLTPTENDVLLLACVGLDAGGDTISADNSFSDISHDSVGSCYSFAYKIPGGAPSALNETWTVSFASTYAAIQAAFRPAWNKVQRTSVESNATSALNITLNGTVAKNQIFALVTQYAGGTPPVSMSVADNVNGAYKQAIFQGSGANGNAVSISYFENGAGGNLTVTATPDSTQVVYAEVAEFSGSPPKNSQHSKAGQGGNSSGNPVATPTLHPCDDALVLAVATVDGTFNTITENNGSEGFTLLSKDDQTQANNLTVSNVYKVMNGAAGAVSESWGLVYANDYSEAIAAFSPVQIPRKVIIGPKP